MGRPKREGIPKTKWCSECCRTKPIIDFSISLPRDWRLSPTIREICKACHSNRQKYRETGVTPKQRADALEEQNGVCKLCNGMYEKPGEKLKTDHCHKTGVFRGMICQECNHTVRSHTRRFLIVASKYVATQGFNMKGQSESNTPGS